MSRRSVFEVFSAMVMICILTVAGLVMIHTAFENNQGTSTGSIVEVTVVSADKTSGSRSWIPFKGGFLPISSSDTYTTKLSLNGIVIESNSMETYELLRGRLNETLTVELITTEYKNGRMAYDVARIIPQVSSQQQE